MDYGWFVRMVIVIASAFAFAATALAADLPDATAMAQRGSLKLVARVLLNSDPMRSAELKATWLDAKQRCDVNRQLRVSYRIDLVRGSVTTRRRPPAKTGLVTNCSEGGPNFGFDVTARGLGMACANGDWKPGFYSIDVRALDLRSGLSVSAFLYRHVEKAC